MSEEGRRLEGRLRARAARPDLDGRVHFAGRLSDPRPLLRSAWCLLHCADREPFGKVILEALASGRPGLRPRKAEGRPRSWMRAAGASTARATPRERPRP